jgi:type II secretory ATPase GspE/PulE/Tfp pilus assembly ATPase PilB-like protein
VLIEAYGPDLYRQDNLPGNYKEIKMAVPGHCKACDNLGYSGRLAVHELLINNDKIKKAIQKNEQTKIILDLALESGMRTLREDGIQKALLNITSFKEIIRVTG